MLATQHEFGASSGAAKHLMGGGMIVMKIVNAVAPLGRPAVTLKSFFQDSCRIGSVRLNSAAIEQHGELFIVGHPSVARKLDDAGFYVTGV